MVGVSINAYTLKAVFVFMYKFIVTLRVVPMTIGPKLLITSIVFPLE